MSEFAPNIRVPGVVAQPTPETRRELDLDALLPGAQDWRLEIGFGAGEHLVTQALRHPEIGYIGCEHYIDGVATLVAAVAARGIENLRLHPHDARDLIDALPAARLGRVYLLYPDPWPKKRHHKRRFFNDANLDALARAMRPGAEIRVATDIDDYARHCLQIVQTRDDFAWTARRADDWRKPWPNWPGTRYEAKALAAGRTPCYLIFQRI